MTTNCHKLSEEKGTNCQPLQKCSCGSPVCSGGNSGFYLKQSFRLPAQYVLIGRFCAASASSLRSRSKFPAPLLSGSRVCATFHSTHVGVVHTAAALCIFFFFFARCLWKMGCSWSQGRFIGNFPGLLAWPFGKILALLEDSVPLWQRSSTCSGGSCVLCGRWQREAVVPSSVWRT